MAEGNPSAFFMWGVARILVLGCCLMMATDSLAQNGTTRNSERRVKSTTTAKAAKKDSLHRAARIPEEASLHADLKKRKKVVIVPAPPPPPGPDPIPRSK